MGIFSLPQFSIPGSSSGYSRSPETRERFSLETLKRTVEIERDTEVDTGVSVMINSITIRNLRPEAGERLQEESKSPSAESTKKQTEAVRLVSNVTLRKAALEPAPLDDIRARLNDIRSRTSISEAPTTETDQPVAQVQVQTLPQQSTNPAQAEAPTGEISVVAAEARLDEIYNQQLLTAPGATDSHNYPLEA